MPVEKASAPSAPLKDLPPDLANYSKYRFLRELGRGGMGVVYQAEQTVMGRSVAIKVINPSVLDHPDALPRFQGEVIAAANLDHPNIVRAYDAEQVGSMHLLVMEYVEGTSLADLVAKKGPLSVAYACHYIRQAALGLQHAFEKGMVHRDIKPQNLMVNARGQVKVLDFGLARMQSERKAGGGLTQVDAFMGTPEYVSPEQATDARSADTRADIYSLGCTLFFLLAGRPPFQGGTAVKLIMAHIEKEAPALHEVRADVPAELSAVVARMLAKDPAHRFQTPVEVAQALAAFVKAGTKPAMGVASPPSGVSSPSTGTALAADTSQIKAILPDVPGKVPAPNAPDEAETASVFAGLGESVASAKKKGKPARKAAKPVAAAALSSSQKKWLLGGGIGVGVLLLALLGMWASVVTVKTPNGTIVVENVPTDAEVQVVGQTVTLTRKGDVVTVTAVLQGPYTLKVVQDGQEIWSRDVTVKLGGDPIRLKCEPVVAPPRPPMPSPDTAKQPADAPRVTTAAPAVRPVRPKADYDPVPKPASSESTGSKPQPNGKETTDANALNSASWEVVRSPGKQPQAYRDALVKAEKASELEPANSNILNTLGVACYRTGAYARAVEILERTLPLNEKQHGSAQPADLAFLAMAHQQLGHTELAGKYLERLHLQVKKIKGAIADESLAFLQEAEDLIEPGNRLKRLTIDVDAAKKAYHTALGGAQRRLIAAFGVAVKQLAVTKMDAKERQRQINCLEIDLRAFKTKKQLPWSWSMRTAAMAYLSELKSATDHLANVRSYLLRRYRRPQESDKKVEQLLASMEPLLAPHVIGTWSCKGLSFNASFVWKLYSNGKINDPNGASTWSLEQSGMTLHIHTPQAPGGVWIDSCEIGVAGQYFKAKNQRNATYEGRLLR